MHAYYMPDYVCRSQEVEEAFLKMRQGKKGAMKVRYHVRHKSFCRPTAPFQWQSAE